VGDALSRRIAQKKGLHYEKSRTKASEGISGMKRWIFIILLSLITCAAIAAGVGRWVEEGWTAMAKQNIRESVIAGSWYPGDPATLTKDIKGYLARVPEKKIDGELVALISPHAGYIYSGQVAAYSYELLEGRHYDIVVIVAPSHHARFHGASIYPRGGFRTPLGIVPIDETICDELLDKSPITNSLPEAHAQEHSLEIQLPFLQVVLKDFKLVPIVMGEQDLATCEELGRVIAAVIKGKNALVVASTDLSHFHPYDQAKALDKVVLDRVAAFDAQGLSRDLDQGRCEACGGGPVVAVMVAARALGADKGEVLHYANSGDVTGDRSSVVGYMAAALYKSKGAKTQKEPKKNKVGVDLGLNAEEKKTLHDIAHTVIWNKVAGKPVPEFHVESERLKELRGAFVTITKKGTLRGCIGHIRGLIPLYKTIEEMAAAAAFDDPRFPPITKNELKDLEIEISVLTPFRQITDVKEIEVGKHGIYIEKGYYSGLLLPQVATEYRWDRDTFLEHTCRKAGLPPDAWKEKDTRIYIFSADIF
jgi:AmmeMemoRadiSam system protein B/AmmeMemoRadiSam system protein A